MAAVRAMLVVMSRTTEFRGGGGRFVATLNGPISARGLGRVVVVGVVAGRVGLGPPVVARDLAPGRATIFCMSVFLL